MAKKKHGKHLQFYIDSMHEERMYAEGLCCCSSDCSGPLDEYLLELFEPTDEDRAELLNEGKPRAMWGSGIEIKLLPQNDYVFTPLRQTIVLFMAAINNEL